MKLSELKQYLDDLFNIKNIPDYSNNGLQVEASTEINKISFAVDASLSGFEKAAELDSDLMIVHHGLFWNKVEMLTGYYAKRLRVLFENNISLYAMHLPLDMHGEFGNNVALSKIAGLDVSDWFGYEKGVNIGCLCDNSKLLSYEQILQNIENALGSPPIDILPRNFKGNSIKKVGIITGGGMSFLNDAAELGVDLYITGEPGHKWYHQILELGIPCVFYGHYLTETVGLKSLQDHLTNKFNFDCSFIDDPTGF